MTDFKIILKNNNKKKYFLVLFQTEVSIIT